MSKRSSRNNQNQIQPMQQKDRRRRWTADEAQAELDAWRQSGLTMAAYCRQRGLHVNRLYNWRKRLEEWVASDRAGGGTGPRCKKSLRLIEATVATQSIPALTLRMGDGGCIEVADPERVDTEWLIQLVRGLSEPELR